MQKFHFTIPCSLPGLNELINAERTHRLAGANLKKKAEKIIRLAIREQLKNVNLQNPVFLVYSFYEKNRRRDKDNIASFAHKVIQDSLVLEKVIPNDGWHNIIGFFDRFFIDTDRPRVEVLIIEQEK